MKLNYTQKTLLELFLFTFSVWFGLSAMILIYCYSGQIGEFLSDLDTAITKTLTDIF